MAANAPYFQLRGQFTNATNAQFATTDDHDYDLAASLAPHNAALYADRQSEENPVNTLEENHNLVELLEAATTAAGQAAEATSANAMHPGDTMLSSRKRKRGDSPSGDGVDEQEASYTQRDMSTRQKRARMDVPTDPQLREPDGRGHHVSERESLSRSSESLLQDARAAGVHSAAALFRRSSKEPTRKYTRPPMSKLFISLQLTPENFLHLQAQAKAYMLDTTHPERQSCVGNRGKGDTDMVKLRLFNCVREFLSDGAGEQFFGENVDKPALSDTIEAARALGEDRTTQERLVWPRDGNTIIGLVTPLLRRMVTNERQRMYAIETRKGGKRKEDSVESQVHGSNDHGEHGLELQSPLQDSNPLSLPLAQSQHSYQTSPVASLPHHRLSIPTQGAASSLVMPASVIRVRAGADVYELRQTEEDLPTANSFDLRKINIQLAKNHVKLDMCKQIRTSQTVMSYRWDQLHDDIKYLLGLALATYPALRPENAAKSAEGMGPEALRGLAVAASEMENQSNTGNISSTEAELATRNVLDLDRSLIHNNHNDTNEAQQAESRTTPPLLAQTRSGLTPPSGPVASPVVSTDMVNTSGYIQYPRLPLSEKSSLHEESIQPEGIYTSNTGVSPSSSPLERRPQATNATPQAPNPSAIEESWNVASLKLPEYTVFVMLTGGLTKIVDGGAWERAKGHLGSSVWAEGRMSVVVEIG
ncbi:hypothetical protein B0J11DRAFT_287709 [Dendryphion nanum]|uniref:Uncharacterized protein n=1 Tax=Dendryphion nanum TaxID=256645 RepID=A0A9P9DX18_9PLEO|nr:hypothetical protein B0J11DRAFT_287709 [Dendryphion nanum]